MSIFGWAPMYTGQMATFGMPPISDGPHSADAQCHASIYKTGMGTGTEWAKPMESHRGGYSH